MTKASNSALDRYSSAHWGIDAKHTLEVDNPSGQYPAEVVQMGKLVELRWVDDTGKKGSMKLSSSRLCFSNDSAETLFCFHSSGDAAKGKKLWSRAEYEATSLKELAKMAGGRQARHVRANVRVRPLGHCTHVLYSTHKKGDGPSTYIHELGEESGVKPILCVSQTGIFWFAGGNYTVPDEGITD